MVLKTNPSELSVVLATDCGSTTTKAVLFEKTVDGWRQTFRGEAPTTVEKPVADVTIGAVNAFLEVQELSGRKILKDSFNEGEHPFVLRTESDPGNGIDLYISTSSAGGGLQMIVAGVVSTMTTESAERAALGAGAIVMDTISIDDGREPYERVQKIRHLRPDIVLIAGGVDGGNANHPLELAELVLQADPRPRFGTTLRLPVLYAGNKDVQKEVGEIIGSQFEVSFVDNIRPKLEEENLAPTRDAIHELFLHHVMSHAPGYGKLLEWSPIPVVPTPAAFGDMVKAAATEQQLNILAVDIGGATTDVFSVFHTEEEPVFNRTVSANLGMSYSVGNVLLEAGEGGIRRWLPYEITSSELTNRLRNKMIRPTSIPHTLDDLILEQAVCREALRLAVIHHKRLAAGLKGAMTQRTIGDLFSQSRADSLVDMMALDLIIGSGGVLSHAPDRKSAAFMLLDAYAPEGVTTLAVDSIFMMPHLGVLSSIHPEAAVEILHRDCLVHLGTAIAPVALSKVKKGTPLADISWGNEQVTLHYGELLRKPLVADTTVEVTIIPASRGIDVGAGKGKELQTSVTGGEAGLLLDGRGRPLPLENDSSKVASWYGALGLPVSSEGKDT